MKTTDRYLFILNKELPRNYSNTEDNLYVHLKPSFISSMDQNSWSSLVEEAMNEESLTDMKQKR